MVAIEFNRQILLTGVQKAGTSGSLGPQWVAGRSRIGVTAGASAPEVLVQQVVAKLKALGAERVTPLAGIEERVEFPLPKALSL